MSGLYITMPIAGVEIFWPGLLILGLGVGVIGGFFGMGGAWMVTPGLNILGFPMAFAIGTDIAHMAGKSLVSTMRHSKFGNVDYRLGVVMIAGTVCGFEVGAQMIMSLERMGRVDLFVQIGYLLLLSLIATLVFSDLLHRRRNEQQARAAGKIWLDSASGIEWYKVFHRLRIPPIMHFRAADIRCSVWLPILVGFFTGWLAGILGIGGGLIRMPALIYLIGVPTHVAVGTDLFEVAISGLYGAASYTYKGRTELVAAVVMLVGASVGAQIGSVATKYVRGYGIRVFFGIAVLGCAVSVALKLLGSFAVAWRGRLETAAAVLILGLVVALSSLIVVRFLRGVRAELRIKRQQAAAALLGRH